MKFTILYDEPQEAAWFRSLHPDLQNASEESITRAQKWPFVKDVLSYDRPDIILIDNEDPILVIEETIEVPSGHNVGQRFARIAAAAENHVPCLYFGPYVAKKHGGDTSGPRYMNLRLFYALDAMVRKTGTAVTTINWPVDKHCEVRRDSEKDDDVREYISTFLSLYRSHGIKNINRAMLESNIHKKMMEERQYFSDNSIRKPEQYDNPPNSVSIIKTSEFLSSFKVSPQSIPSHVSEVVLYNVGMNNIRSDPYTGMAMLYHYLYIAEHRERILVLWFPNIKWSIWKTASQGGSRKDIRLFRIAADAILFSDNFVLKNGL